MVLPANTDLTLRFAFPDDERAVARLAELDSAVAPAGPLLLAEVSGELLVAVSLRDLTVIANPFQRTADITLVALARARQLRRPVTSPRRGASALHALRQALGLSVDAAG